MVHEGLFVFLGKWVSHFIQSVNETVGQSENQFRELVDDLELLLWFKMLV